MSMLSWPKAVKAWNGAAAWKDDLYALPKKGGEFYDEVRELMGQKKPATPAPVAAVLPATPAPAPVVAPEVREQGFIPTNYRPLSEEQKEESEKANAQIYINNIQSLTTYFRPEDWAKSSSNDKIDTYQTIKNLNEMKSGLARVSKYLKPYLDFKLPEKVQKGYDKWVALGKPSKYSTVPKPVDNEKIISEYLFNIK